MSQSQIRRTVSRRGVLVAGGVIGVASVAAACGGSSGEGSANEEAAEQESGTEEGGESPASSSAAPAGAELAPVSAIPVGGGKVFDGPQVVITQPADGTIKGFTAVCPHQGCLVSTVQDNEILCPCHGSLFSAEDGSVIQGPATTGLAPVAVSVDGGTVLLG